MGFIAVYADWVTLHRVLLQFSLFMTPPNFVRGVQARNPSRPHLAVYAESYPYSMRIS